MKIVLKQPDETMVSLYEPFFQETIRNTFAINDIDDPADTEYQITDKTSHVLRYIELHPDNEFFLSAFIENELAGIAGFFPVNEDILNAAPSVSKNCIEIGSVYIKPKYQRRGITKILLHHLFDEMKKRKIDFFYLDAGYPSSQIYWKKILGEPEIILESHYKDGSAYMIWKCKL